jgi:conjugal transfer mating pair stabilization protein TraN
MWRLCVFAGLAVTLSTAGALAQTMQDAKRDGQTFGQAQAAVNQGAADTGADAQSALPGYNGANAPETVYMGNPASLDAAKPAVAATNQGYRLTVDGNLTRPRIAPSEVDATVARGNAVNQDPATYAQGLANGQTGQCVPLPPSTTTTGTFEATCNKGLALQTAAKSCPITLTHNFGPLAHQYQCTRLHEKGRICLQGTPSNCTEPDFVDDDIGSGCDAYEASGVCTMQTVSSVQIRPGNFRTAPVTFQTLEATCAGDVAGTVTGTPLRVAGVTYTPGFIDLGSTQPYLGSTQDISQCSALAADSNCTGPVDVCTDASPATRNINGVDITQSCWAWSRTYTCTGTVPANDCAAGTIPQGCTFNREECLDDPAPADPRQCKVFQEVYTCPITGQDPKSQYVCGGDVYCINGDCEPIVREASTEFKDALVGLHTLDQSAKEFNSIDYTLFKGAGTTCSKPVFGLGNCCGGRGFPLIGTCTAADRLLAGQIDKGLTHYVGTYCAKSFIVCTTKAQSYCVFSSKLTRILQEQGRPQLGKTWGTAKKPNCAGFTVDEFSRLDLSVMDFAEIYQDFIEAAKLPNEAATLTDIQAKIEAYYNRGP